MSPPYFLRACLAASSYKSVGHIEGDFVGCALFSSADAKGRAESELRRTRIVVINISVLVFGLRRSEHLVLGQPAGRRAFVAVHPVSLVMGDFLEFVAELGKLVPQRRV